MPQKRYQHVVPTNDGWAIAKHRAELLKEWERSQADE